MMRTPEAWDKFVDEVEAARTELRFKRGEYALYRGHADNRYTLTPSLFRTPGLEETAYDELESDLFFEFQARAHQLHGQSLTDWDFLFHMRHHGVPTRLLDWTELLGVALYFAVHGYEGSQRRQPSIWLVNPWSLNKKSWLGRELVAPRYLGWDPKHWEYDDYGELLVLAGDFKWDLPVAIYPQQINPRMASQKGLFTIHGNEIGPLEKLYPRCVREVNIPLDAISYILDYLQTTGMDTYLLFPDLDGLARALCEKYSLSGRAEERVSGRTPKGETERQPTAPRRSGRKTPPED